MKAPRLSLEQINALMTLSRQATTAAEVTCERSFISYETLIVKLRFHRHATQTSFTQYLAWDKARACFAEAPAHLFEARPQVIDAQANRLSQTIARLAADRPSFDDDYRRLLSNQPVDENEVC